MVDREAIFGGDPHLVGVSIIGDGVNVAAQRAVDDVVMLPMAAVVDAYSMAVGPRPEAPLSIDADGGDEITCQAGEIVFIKMVPLHA